MSPVIVRLLLALAIGAVLVSGWKVLTWSALRRSSRKARHLSQFTRGTPGVLYFTTPDCVTCRVAQKPALKELSQRLGPDVQVIELDALEHSRLAREWAVLSVPTTFVLDRDGRPRQVNYGFASADKLVAQLAAVS